MTHFSYRHSTESLQHDQNYSMINKPKTYYFGIECNVFYFSSV